ncbi:MAG: Gfo/Idh/MocA family oxidoreductase [Rubrivivax sp.]|nr:Gfo/Idh/MocA family oxidoreductase [Rubrivivax sp.]
MPRDVRPTPATPLPAAAPSPAPGPARLPVALLGAGQIGRMHAARMQRHADVVLAGVADPSPAARDWAGALGVPWAADAGELLDRVRPRAALVATPNQLHCPVALACIERGIVPLVEKPIADTVEAAARIAAAARTAGVPVLVGHQRRHNAMVQRARRLIAEGAIGRPVAVSLLAAWLKPDAYFDVAWRREKGGGPVLINAIHDIDLLRHLVGEVVSVQAVACSARRGFEVEDTAAAVLRLAGDALATLLVTDSAVSPWNYDLASGESELYARQAVDALFIAGSAGALALPQGNLWRYRGEGGAARHWHGELTQECTPVHHRDPYAEQLRHLRAVAEGRELPLCSAEDGLATLRATLAVLEAAAGGRPVVIGAAAEVHNPAS